MSVRAAALGIFFLGQANTTKVQYVYIFWVLFSFAVEKWLRLYHLVNVTMRKGTKKNENKNQPKAQYPVASAQKKRASSHILATHEAPTDKSAKSFSLIFFIPASGLFYSSDPHCPVDKWVETYSKKSVEIWIINTA